MTDDETYEDDVYEGVFEATNVRDQLDRLNESEAARQMDFPETMDEFCRRVVEDGTFKPDGTIDAVIPLTWRQRLAGRIEEDVTPIMVIGMMLGAALERDVPEGTALEESWRDGAFVLPDDGGDD